MAPLRRRFFDAAETCCMAIRQATLATPFGAGSTSVGDTWAKYGVSDAQAGYL